MDRKLRLMIFCGIIATTAALGWWLHLRMPSWGKGTEPIFWTMMYIIPLAITLRKLQKKGLSNQGAAIGSLMGGLLPMLWPMVPEAGKFLRAAWATGSSEGFRSGIIFAIMELTLAGLAIGVLYNALGMRDSVQPLATEGAAQ